MENILNKIDLETEEGRAVSSWLKKYGFKARGCTPNVLVWREPTMGPCIWINAFAVPKSLFPEQYDKILSAYTEFLASIQEAYDKTRTDNIKLVSICPNCKEVLTQSFSHYCGNCLQY